ncbi:MAG: hypothetical protein J6P83_06085 [Bacteroidales bacterium]|nr:hypothetical protein [Bacteroidales bacterium]
MKKLVMTFAIVAFLIGGLTINASAQVKAAKQDNKSTKQAKTEQKVESKAVTGKEVNYDQVIKDYEKNVDSFIKAYEKFLKDGSDENKKVFESYRDAALKLEGQLDKAKDKLNRTQVDNFKKIKARFAKAMAQKG